MLRKGIKIRREAVEQYTKAGRAGPGGQRGRSDPHPGRVSPSRVDPAEIRAAVREAIAGGAKDIGKVMGQVLPRFKGRAEGKVINQIVREELQAG